MARQSASWDELEKEVALIRQLVKRMPGDEQVGAAIRIAFEAALWAGTTPAEMIGILEMAKQEIWHSDWEEQEEEQEETE